MRVITNIGREFLKSSFQVHTIAEDKALPFVTLTLKGEYRKNKMSLKKKVKKVKHEHHLRNTNFLEVLLW